MKYSVIFTLLLFLTSCLDVETKILVYPDGNALLETEFISPQKKIIDSIRVADLKSGWEERGRGFKGGRYYVSFRGEKNLRTGLLQDFQNKGAQKTAKSKSAFSKNIFSGRYVVDEQIGSDVMPVNFKKLSGNLTLVIRMPGKIVRTTGSKADARTAVFHIPLIELAAGRKRIAVLSEDGILPGIKNLGRRPMDMPKKMYRRIMALFSSLTAKDSQEPHNTQIAEQADPVKTKEDIQKDFQNLINEYKSTELVYPGSLRDLEKFVSNKSRSLPAGAENYEYQSYTCRAVERKNQGRNNL